MVGKCKERKVCKSRESTKEKRAHEAARTRRERKDKGDWGKNERMKIENDSWQREGARGVRKGATRTKGRRWREASSSDRSFEQQSNRNHQGRSARDDRNL